MATPAGHAAIAADIAPGKSRLNVLAGRQASVHGRVLSGAAGRPALLQRRSRSGMGDDRPGHHARRRRLRLRLPSAAVRERPAARARRRGAARDRPAQRLPPRLGVVVRPRPVRQQALVWRAPGPRHARRRAQDAAVRHARDPAQGRPRDPRARRRPRPVRRRARVRPDVRHAREAALRRRRLACSSPADARPRRRHGRGVRSGGWRRSFPSIHGGSSRTSTATRSMRASSCSAVPSCAASPSSWPAAGRARWSPPPATRRGASACTRPCRRSARAGCAPTRSS